MAMLIEDQLREILNGALVTHPNMSATELVQTALRVAVLRDDPLAESWLRIELEGIRKESGKSPEISECHSRLAALVGTDRAQEQVSAAIESLIARRTMDGKNSVSGQSIGELESLNRATQELHDTPITPGMTPIDTGLASIDRTKMRATTTPILMQQGAIIQRVRQAAFGYLVRVEAELVRGQSVPDVIAQGRAFVEATLAVRAPDAHSALLSAQDRLAQDDDESLSHAATSCRRAIKALADALFPPSASVTDSEGATRVLDDERYRNRLVEYVRSSRGRSTHADLLASNISALATRFKSLDDLASKGVHAGIRRAEAESCVNWTYMLAADLLRIEEERESVA